jgi:hypothetical protein
MRSVKRIYYLYIGRVSVRRNVRRRLMSRVWCCRADLLGDAIIELRSDLVVAPLPHSVSFKGIPGKK